MVTSNFSKTPAYNLAIKLIDAAKNYSGYNFSIQDLKNIWRHLCVEGINMKSKNYGLGQRKSTGGFARYNTGKEVLDTVYKINQTHPGILGAQNEATYGQKLEFSPYGSYSGRKNRQAYANQYGSASYKTMDRIFKQALIDSNYTPKTESKLETTSPKTKSELKTILDEVAGEKLVEYPDALKVQEPLIVEPIKMQRKGGLLLKKDNMIVRGFYFNRK